MAQDTRSRVKRRLPLVEVRWEDSTSFGGWKTREQYAREKPAECVSAGYLLSRTRQAVTLVMSQCVEAERDTMDGLVIPAGAVRAIRRLGYGGRGSPR